MKFVEYQKITDIKVWPITRKTEIKDMRNYAKFKVELIEMLQTIKVASRPFRHFLIRLWDKRLDWAVPIRVDGKKIFKIYDYGRNTRFRASSFEEKEPETLEWIESFSPGENFLDIGANVGIYTLYAASRGHKTVAIEPDALNYALLNRNIRLNRCGEKVMPYLIAAHNETKFSIFNISSHEWGGALNSFDNCLDCNGETYKPVHSQGVFGISLDRFLEQIDFQPSHIKIDVDGNELLILQGAHESLRSRSLKTVLVELDEARKDYDESIQLLKEAGFSLELKTHAEKFYEGQFATIYNHIFIKTR